MRTRVQRERKKSKRGELLNRPGVEKNHEYARAHNNLEKKKERRKKGADSSIKR